ncbi:DgyrCDS3238 [Dimorphilus gyrociliatus]|uniref:DgyrCDS3238 n=1 Tax=Dimorphilus gyrociliatus TaxID=2664684 RepID=A0A7I8VEE1_9ANNE|nr:DgyrCDS3238 [Dimorphilus gyrociliatus]
MIPGSHPGGPGSIPGLGTVVVKYIHRLGQRTKCHSCSRLNGYELSAEHKLIGDLLNEYDRGHRSARPLRDSTHALQLNMTLFLLRLIDLDPKEEVMTSIVEVHYSWIDEFLTWNKTNYDNLDMISINIHEIWKPSVIVTNLVEPNKNFYPIDQAIVHSSGKVFLEQIEILKTFCEVDITYFPFEYETCELIYGNLVHDSDAVHINYVPYRNDSYEGFHGFSDKEDEWQILETKHTIYRNYSKATNLNKHFTVMIFSISLKRNAVFLVIVLFLPCFLLIFLNLLSTFIPPNSTEKVNLALSVFLSYFVLLLIVMDHIPLGRRVPAES